MLDNHDYAVEKLKGFLKKLPKHEYNRALEVACGTGILTRDLLSKYYDAVDMFDH